MKKSVMMFLHLFFFVQIAICQNEIIYESNNIVLSIDFRIKEYSIWKDSDSDSKADVVIEKPDISEGKIRIEGNFIICIDKISNMKMSFEKIDEYRLAVTNKNCCFDINDTLYAVVISNQYGNPIQRLKWKEGKRHGVWSFHDEKGVNYTLYEDGRITKEYFRTYKEIKEGIQNAPYCPSDKQ